MHDDMMLRSLDVAVLCGGPGSEREVSLASGDNVFRTLREGGYAARLVTLPENEPEKCLAALECDIAVMMLHGEFGEDGTAQSILDAKGIAYTGSEAGACVLAMDKDAAKRRFLANGIPTPRWMKVEYGESAEGFLWGSGLQYPLVVKPNSRGSSVGTSIVRKEEDFAPAVASARKFDDAILLEEFVAGRELTVGWLDGRVLSPIELVPDGVFYDYKAKYVSDKTRYLCPAPLSSRIYDEIIEETSRVCEILGVRDLARVDIMLGERGPTVLELNTLPGFTSHSLLPMAAKRDGVPLTDLCRMLVSMAWRRWRAARAAG